LRINNKGKERYVVVSGAGNWRHGGEQVKKQTISKWQMINENGETTKNQQRRIKIKS